MIAATGLVLALCSGCASTIPLDRAAVAGKISTDLGFPADSIQVVSRCSYLRAHDVSDKPPFQPCLYVALPARALLLDYDATTMRYREIVHFDPQVVQQIGFATFGRARQVQAYTATGIYGVEVESGGLVDQAASQRAFEQLKSMGIPQVAEAKYVRGALQLRGSGPMYIYVPAR
jgi:hypothetical protein